MKYRPKFNDGKTVAETIQSIPKECTYLDLSGITPFLSSQNRNRLIKELAQALPSISPSIRMLNLSYNELLTAPDSGDGIDDKAFCLLMKNIPSWIIYLNLKNNNSCSSNRRFGMLSTISPKLTLDILDLRGNQLIQIWPESEEKISFSVKTILVSSNEIIRMPKNLLNNWANFFPWGSEFRVMDASDAVIFSNKINHLKRQIICVHSQQIRFYDVALTYLGRKKNLPDDVTGHIASYLFKTGGVNVGFSKESCSPYARAFFKPVTPVARYPENPEPIQEYNKEILVNDIYEVNTLSVFFIMYALSFLYLRSRLLTEQALRSNGSNNDEMSRYIEGIFELMLLNLVIDVFINIITNVNPILIAAYITEYICPTVFPFKFVTYGSVPSISFKKEDGQCPPVFDWRLQ